MSKVIMYCSSGCPYCALAEALLTKKGVEIEMKDVDADPGLWDYIYETLDRETVPQVIINNKPVGQIRLAFGEHHPKTFTFPLSNSQDDTYSIRFEIDKPTTPKSVGLNEDARSLGLGFISMKLISSAAVQ